MPGQGGWPFRTSWLTARTGRGDIDRLLPHFLGGTALTGALRDFYFGVAPSGGGTITLVGAAAKTEGIGTAVSVNLPTGMAQDDVLVYARQSDSQTGGVAPSGFTAIGTSGGTQETSIVWDLYYEVQGATPRTSLTVDTGGSVVYSAFVTFALRGVDTTTPLDAALTKATGATGMPDSPAITTVTNGAMVFSVGYLDDETVSTGLTPPSGYTFLAAQDAPTDPANPCTVMVAYKTLATAGAEDPGVWAHATADDNWLAVTTAFRPAAGAGGVTGTATADLSFATMATAAAQAQATASASLSFATVATGASSVKATATASLAFATIATGAAQAKATATADLAFATVATGSAPGANPTGTATADLSFATVATAVAQAKGTATASLAFATLATGASAAKGTATASLAFATLAAGAALAKGTANADLAFATIATGSALGAAPSGQAVISLSFATVATGRALATGAAVSSLVFGFAATGTAPVIIAGLPTAGPGQSSGSNRATGFGQSMRPNSANGIARSGGAANINRTTGKSEVNR